MMSMARLTEPRQDVATNQQRAMLYGGKEVLRGWTFDSRSDSPGSPALGEVYCAEEARDNFFYTSVFKSQPANIRLDLRRSGART
jgi:hypothetical protein